MRKIIIVGILILMIVVNGCVSLKKGIGYYNKYKRVEKKINNTIEESNKINESLSNIENSEKSFCEKSFGIKLSLFILNSAGLTFVWSIPFVGIPLEVLLGYFEYLLFLCTFL